MHQPYGLAPVNVGVNVGLNMASLDQGNQDTENMTGRKQVGLFSITVPLTFITLIDLFCLGHWRDPPADHEHHGSEP